MNCREKKISNQRYNTQARYASHCDVEESNMQSYSSIVSIPKKRKVNVEVDNYIQKKGQEGKGELLSSFWV